MSKVASGGIGVKQGHGLQLPARACCRNRSLLPLECCCMQGHPSRRLITDISLPHLSLIVSHTRSLNAGVLPSVEIGDETAIDLHGHPRWLPPFIKCCGKHSKGVVDNHVAVCQNTPHASVSDERGPGFHVKTTTSMDDRTTAPSIMSRAEYITSVRNI